MRCLDRNKRSFYYALFQEKDSILDEYGNKTGEYRIIYSEPILARANISPANGEVQIEQFSSSLDYDKVIVIDDINCPIDEYSVLCIDSQPTYDSNDNLVYDYIVKKIAKSINSISIAVSKVKVS